MAKKSAKAKGRKGAVKAGKKPTKRKARPAGKKGGKDVKGASLSVTRSTTLPPGPVTDPLRTAAASDLFPKY